MGTVAVCTLGCKVNQYESEAMLELFGRAGYNAVPFPGPADVVIINTCTVTALSDRKSRQMIRRARHANPGAVIVAMGCYVQTAPDKVAALGDVDILIGTGDRARAVELVEQFRREHRSVNIVGDVLHAETFEELPLATYENRTRAFLKVQEGCDRFCSYCIIPYARGHIRSRSVEDTVRETQRLARNGFCEVVLAGIHVASYGREHGGASRLPELLRAVHAVEGIERIRMSSVEPTLFTQEFVELLAGLPKVCPHFHLSLQSGCDETLARMNRRYTTAQYAAALSRLRAAMPDVAVTTDVMVGFPGETEEEFAHSLEFVRACGFADAHVFKYSVREGTRAAHMDGQVAPEVKEARSRAMLSLADTQSRAFRERFVGRTMRVLLEQRSHVDVSCMEGKTANYLTVTVPAGEDLAGQLADVRLTGLDADGMTGELV